MLQQDDRPPDARSSLTTARRSPSGTHPITTRTMSTLPLRRILELAVGPQNVDAAGHAMADWLEARRYKATAAMVRHELSTGRSAELGQEVPHDRPDTSLRAELLQKLATQREVLLSLCDRVDRLEMRADGLTPIERVQRRWAREAVAKDSSATGGDGPAVQGREPASVVREPSDEELTQFLFDGFREWIEFACDAEEEAHGMIRNHVRFARAVLARWGRHSPGATKMASPAEPVEEGPILEEVEELCEEHCFNVEGYESIECLQGLINDALARWGHQPTQHPYKENP